jgi:hypothetical protein
MNVRIALFLLILLTGRTYAADYEMNKTCLQAYDYILSLRFEKAESLLAKEFNANPNNRILSYLRNYAGFLEVVISEDKQRYESFSKENQQLLDHVESGNANSPWHLYTQAQLYLQHSFASLRFGDYANGAIDLNKAYRLLTKNESQYPGFRPNQVALGLLQVLIGSIPQNYQWVTKILAIQGTIEQGTRNMQQALMDPETDLKYPFLKAESIFLLTFTTFNLSENPAQTAETEHFLNDPKNQELIKTNPLLIYAKSVFLMHTGKNEQALETLLAAPQSKDYYPFYYLQYLTGLAKLNRMDSDANVWFLRYVMNFQGNSFIKSAYQRLAWISLIKADTNGYNNYLKRVQLFGNTSIDGDKQAEKEAQSKHIPNALLLKSRLLSDGGYYAKADNILSNLDNNHLKSDYEKLEYQYRISRNNHKWGKTNLAKTDYVKTILLGENQKWYFAANSALQLAIIYENEGNRDKAVQYYKKCLSMNYDEYRTSISQKAKAGLERVK